MVRADRDSMMASLLEARRDLSVLVTEQHVSKMVLQELCSTFHRENAGGQDVPPPQPGHLHGKGEGRPPRMGQ